MKRKIKIVKQPTYGSGGMHTGDQANYGLYRGGGQLQDYLTGPEDSSEKDIRVTYPEVDREGATAEVEKGEYIVSKDMTALYKVGGEKHSKGGTPVFVTGGEYVVSDYVTMPEGLQDVLGFEAKSKKKKDNTIAKLLGGKVDAKEYNRLSKIIQDDLSGKDVDEFELATAKNRMPLYQQYVSKAALGGELAKALQGKDYEIPAIAQIAIENLQLPSRLNEVEQQPLVSAKQGGTLLPKFQDAGQVKKSEIKKYTDLGYIYDPNKETLTLRTAPTTTVTQGTTLPGTPITTVGRSRNEVTYEDVIANPSLYPSFLQKSGWGKAPESEARAAWKTWWTTKQRPIYVPGSSTTTGGGETVLKVIGDEAPTTNGGGTSVVITGQPPSGGGSSIEITGEKPKEEIDKDKIEQQVQKDDAKDQDIDWEPGWTSGRQPWWTQNKLQTALQLYDYLNKEDIYPWEPALTAVFPQTVFRSPRQAIASMQSLAGEQRRGAATFAGPQRYASVASSINAQIGPGITNVIREVDESNRQAAMANSAQSADIANRLIMAQSQRGKRLYDATTMTRAQSRQEDRLKLASLLERGIIPGITEAQKTSWMNAISKYYDVDPRTGKLYFTGGKDIEADVLSGQSLESDMQTIRRLKDAGASTDEAIKYITEMRRGPAGRASFSNDPLVNALLAQSRGGIRFRNQ